MCRIDDCDDRYWPYTVKNVKSSRKPHRCDECSRDIRVGEPYRYVFGVLAGYGGMAHHICQHCCIACDWLLANCGGFVHEIVGEEIDEHIGDYPHLATGLRRFRVGMRRKWQRFDGAGLMQLPPMAKPIEVHHG